MDKKHSFGFVALVGAPNAGKSTLMNKYLGEKVAIVSPKPQTTRNQITGILTQEDAQIVFFDTPGIHGVPGRMNRFLISEANKALSAADVVVLLVDASLPMVKLQKEFIAVKRVLQNSHQPFFIALNKIDKVKEKEKLLPLMEWLAEVFPQASIVPLSALTGKGKDVLLEEVITHLPEKEAEFPADQLSTVPLRFMASEVIREKLFMQLQQELPYSTAVEIEQWQEDDTIVHIDAVIYTGRQSHKGMIIGKQGALLKKIGTSSRVELEDLVEKRIMLKLWVKVKENWTEDVNFLRSLGLG